MTINGMRISRQCSMLFGYKLCCRSQLLTCMPHIVLQAHYSHRNRQPVRQDVPESLEQAIPHFPKQFTVKNRTLDRGKKTRRETSLRGWNLLQEAKREAGAKMMGGGEWAP